MRDKIKRKLEDLRNRRDLRQENKILQEELDGCFRTNNDLLEQLKAAQGQIERLTGVNEELHQKVVELKKRLRPKEVVEEKFSRLMDFWD